MKAIQINFEDSIVPRFAAIVHEDRAGLCYISERAVAFIKAQSLDGQVYDTLACPCDKISCCSNKSIARFVIKKQVYNIEPTDDFSKFMTPKEGEWEWSSVELHVIDIME